MKSRKILPKRIFTALIVVGPFFVILYLALQSGDLSEVKSVVATSRKLWMTGALVCIFVHLFLEAFICYLYYYFQKIKTKMRDNYLVGLIGVYYSSITPAATGGQPMQVHAMRRRGIAPGTSLSAYTVKFFCWQCALLLVGTVLWFRYPSFIAERMHVGIWFLGLGFFVNGLVIVIVLLLSINQNIVRSIIAFIVHILYVLRIIKDKAKSISKWDAGIQDFQASVQLISRHPFQFLVLLLLSIFQVFALLSTVYFIYRGFGLNNAKYIEVFTMQVMLYIAASFTPLPGASGAQEGGFYVFLGSFFPESLIFPAMLVWRFYTYYLMIILGFLGVVLDSALAPREKARSQ